MELWIRSQDKEILKLAEYLDIYDDSVEEQCWVIEESGTDLGKYKSKERAIEVINEIEQRLIDLQTLEIAPDFYKVCKRCLDIVYEMPKE